MGRGSLSRAVIAVSTVGHCRSHAPPLRVHPLRNSLRSFASPSLREGEDFSATPTTPRIFNTVAGPRLFGSGMWGCFIGDGRIGSVESDGLYVKGNRA